MSWFASSLETLSQLSETVQNAIPVDKELLAKLTLNTDEMKAERQQYGDEETRKQAVKEMLSGMFPWETRDTEREILVEECKEAILALSQQEDTFYGPFEMPKLGVKLEEKDGNKGHVENEQESGDDHETESSKNRLPSKEDKEKLAKLEPLPPLLQNFDLDSHVGLIEKLLDYDTNLELQQSKLSGGGPREKVFWHNYFFHCAYTRYEAGLSIDEIWSFQPESADASAIEAAKEAEEAAAVADTEEEVVFHDSDGNPKDDSNPGSAFTQEAMDEKASTATTTNVESTDTSPSGSSTSEFEMLDGDDAGEGSGDPELDELEAEIARELED